MKIAIGCDHGGYELKEHLVAFLKEKGYEVKDCGTYSKESCDYPVFGEAAARAVASGECERGIVVFAVPMYATACARKCAAGTMMQICWRWALGLRVSIWLSGVWKCF